MGMRVVLGWCAMSGPAGMGNADRACQRLPHQLGRQIVEFPLRPAAVQPAVMDGDDTPCIIATIVQPAKATTHQNGREHWRHSRYVNVHVWVDSVFNKE